jgi:hypothetical protein
MIVHGGSIRTGDATTRTVDIGSIPYNQIDPFRYSVTGASAVSALLRKYDYYYRNQGVDSQLAETHSSDGILSYRSMSNAEIIVTLSK